jgi:Outer membrane protein beta-barrel domain
MFARTRRAGRALAWAAVVTWVLLAAQAAQAQQQSQRMLTLGIGTASSSVSGGLDGIGGFTGPGGLAVYEGKPASGTGLVLLGGVQIKGNLGVEAQFISTTHDATHTLLPGQKMTATVSELLVNFRGSVPLGNSLDVFGRAGLGLYVVDYDHNTNVPPSPALTSSTFTGSGFVIGGGMDVFLDPMGLELGAMYQSAQLDSLSAGGVSGTLTPSVSLSQVTVTLTLVVRFGI